MAERYIKVGDLINELGKHPDIYTTIDTTPESDVEEVKHGKWIRCQKLYGIGYEYVCSACEKGIRQYEGQPICSECGAKMDGGIN